MKRDPKRFWRLRLVSVLLVMLPASQVAAQTRRALVIGNSAYTEAPLPCAARDANDMAYALRSLGFSVTKKENISHREMENAIRAFGAEVQPGEQALFYFSGHGAQVQGINYLYPVGMDARSEDEIKYKALPVGMMLDKLERAGSSVNIVILDACRANPYKRFKSLQAGLAPMQAPRGTLIAYATGPGTVALAAERGNSPYTKHLLLHMRAPGVGVETVFKRVRAGILEETNNRQVPWEASSLIGDVYLAPVGPVPRPEPGFVSLFDGKTLAGWIPFRSSGGQQQPGGDDWIVRNGQLICDGEETAWLRSADMYDDFVLELEFKIPAHANSGVLVRHRPGGPWTEIQLLGTGFSTDPRVDETKQTGAVFAILPVRASVQRGSDEWNTMQIRCEGEDIEVRLNGTVIVEENMQRVEKLRDRPRSGFIAFLNFTGQGRGMAQGMALRNIRIREL